MTLAVDRAVKPQHKQTKLNSTLYGAGASAKFDTLDGIGHSPYVQHQSVCLVW